MKKTGVKGVGRKENEMASQIVKVRRKGGVRGRESEICCFFDFNQKQRRSAVEKSMTKSKVHMS